MKTVLEWSNSFDTSIAAYSHKAEFGSQSFVADIVFDEYEKTLFLTLAQEEIVIDLYSGHYNGDSFEATELLRRELESLVELIDYTSSENSLKIKDKYEHSIYTLPNRLLYIVYELATLLRSKECTSIVDVYPVTHDEYWRITNNPFRGPNSRRVLRLDKGNNLVELVSTDAIASYVIRYLKRPDPIILTNLSADLEVEGLSTPQPCKLHESLHKLILDRAVKLALASKYINNTKDNGGK